MGRAPCCDKANVKKGPWSPEEDVKLKEYIEKYGTGGNWIALPHKAGLKRCGKSCRLRWLNYLRPNIKHGEFSDEEDRVICSLFASIGSRWSVIAAQLPGRTDNDIKNYWNTKLKKKLFGREKDQQTNRIASQKSQANSTLLTKFPLLETNKSEPSILSFENLHYSSSLFMNSQQQQKQQKQSIQHDQHSGLESSSEITHLNYIWQSLLSLNADQNGPLSNCAFGGDQSCTSSDGSYQRQAVGMKNEMIPSELILDTINLESLLLPSKAIDNQNSYRFANGGNNGGFEGETAMWCATNLFSDYEESKPFPGQEFNNFFLGTALGSSNISHCFSQDRLMY